MRAAPLEEKRVSAARVKSALSWAPDYPSYREGLRDLVGGQLRPFGQDDMAMFASACKRQDPEPE